MTAFQAFAAVSVLAAILAWTNHRWIRLPTTIGLMVLSLGLSLLILAVGTVVPDVRQLAAQLLATVNFDDALLHGMLGYLLFAGALHVDLGDLARQKLIIAILATLGVVTSTAMVAGMTWAITQLLGLELPFALCLLFGTLISPTDPIAVLGLLKRLGVPKSLATKFAGESLFNDGVAVVLFLVVAQAAGVMEGHAHGAGGISMAQIAQLFAVEVAGGALFGFVIGWLAYRMLAQVDHYQVEVLISIALVTGGYATAEALHISAPIAVVVAGLLIGNHGRSFAMSETTRNNLDMFWELVDEVLNALLFVLIGLELLVISFSFSFLLAGALAIPATLLARFAVVATPMAALRRVRGFTPHAAKLLTWGGLRGGISVAMALWLGQMLADDSAARDLILTMTYVVVVFSIGVQGLTIAPLVRRWGLDGAPAEPRHDSGI